MATVSSKITKESAPIAPMLSAKMDNSNKESTPTEQTGVKGSPSSAVTSFTPGQSDSTVSPANDKDAKDASPNESDVNVSRDSGMETTDVSQVEIGTGSNRTGSDSDVKDTGSVATGTLNAGGLRLSGAASSTASSTGKLTKAMSSDVMHVLSRYQNTDGPKPQLSATGSLANYMPGMAYSGSAPRMYGSQQGYSGMTGTHSYGNTAQQVLSAASSVGSLAGGAQWAAGSAASSVGSSGQQQQQHAASANAYNTQAAQTNAYNTQQAYANAYGYGASAYGTQAGANGQMGTMNMQQLQYGQYANGYHEHAAAAVNATGTQAGYGTQGYTTEQYAVANSMAGGMTYDYIGSTDFISTSLFLRLLYIRFLLVFVSRFCKLLLRLVSR